MSPFNRKGNPRPTWVSFHEVTLFLSSCFYNRINKESAGQVFLWWKFYKTDISKEG